jgi:hypothetical protein
MSTLILEVVEPFTVKEDGRVTTWAPGQQMRLSPAKAQRVLACVGNKVRVVEGDNSPIELCDASPTARPIYWKSPDGTWCGPATPEFLDRVGTGSQERFWIVTTYQGAIRWVRSDLLRNRQAFESQVRLRCTDVPSRP